jgi:O-antigen ligase
VLAILLGAGTGLTFMVAAERFGPYAALLPIAGLAAAYLVSSPSVTLAALLGLVIAVEADPVGLLPIGSSVYAPVRYGQALPDILFGLLVAGTALELARRRQHPRGIGPMTLPLLALAAASAGGFATGYFADAGATDLARSAGRFSELLLLPFLVANLVRDTEALRACLAGAGLLVAFKAITGLLAAASGAGFTVDGGTITFYEPVANWLLLMFLLFMLAAWVRRVPLPAWAHWLAPLALLALVLSYRRSFWLAGAFAIVLVLVLASRQRGRTALAIVGTGLVLVLVGTLTLGDSSEVRSPVLERARSLQPGEISSDAADRYRIDERRNVMEDIRRHPLTGLGMNVPWTARYPLSEEHDRNYTHIVLLWYWLKLGILGVISFVWLYAVALWTALRVWRRHPDPVIQLGALAAVGGLVGLVIVELTASFTGVEPRLSIVFGALLGLIAAAWRQLPQERSARATAWTE